MLMTRHVLDQAGIDPNDPAGRGAAARLRLRQRANKEILFNEEKVSVELNDDVRLLTLDDFLANKRVQEFTERLRSKFSASLATAIECAKQYSPRRDRPVPIEVILTGGGHSLPMVADLASNPPLPWTYTTPFRDISNLPNDPGLQAVNRQLAVAIGGAVEDLPRHTAPVLGVSG
jgi:molecular chaperone DnaK (HSP70)